MDFLALIIDNICFMGCIWQAPSENCAVRPLTVMKIEILLAKCSYPYEQVLPKKLSLKMIRYWHLRYTPDRADPIAHGSTLAKCRSMNPSLSDLKGQRRLIEREISSDDDMWTMLSLIPHTSHAIFCCVGVMKANDLRRKKAKYVKTLRDYEPLSK